MKIKTLIYTYRGFYVSESLWHDPVYAWEHGRSDEFISIDKIDSPLRAIVAKHTDLVNDWYHGAYETFDPPINTDSRVKGVKNFDKYGNFIGTIPAECVKDCSHAGSCDSDVANWVNKLNFRVTRVKATPWLLQWGAWDAKELKAMTILELSEIVLGLACGDIKETGEEWCGLV